MSVGLKSNLLVAIGTKQRMAALKKAGVGK